MDDPCCPTAHSACECVLQGSKSLRVGVAEMQGWRNSQEDRHCICLDLPDHPHWHFVGVFDGHGGREAADYCATQFVKRIGKLKRLDDENELRACFLGIDRDFIQAHKTSGTTVAIALIKTNPRVVPHTRVQVPERDKENDDISENICSDNDSRHIPSTVLFDDKEQDDPVAVRVVSVHVGDAAVMVTRAPDHVEILSLPEHKPTLPAERDRVVAAGGQVLSMRVDGELAVSRAIGDERYKQQTALSAEQQKVCAVPDVTVRDIRLSELSHTLLLVCCDGLLEAMSATCAVDKLWRTIEQVQQSDGTLDPCVVAQRLLDASLDAGSRDNHTLAVVAFVDGQNFGQGRQYIYVPPTAAMEADSVLMQCYTEDLRRAARPNDAELRRLQELVARQQSVFADPFGLNPHTTGMSASSLEAAYSRKRQQPGFLNSLRRQGSLSRGARRSLGFGRVGLGSPNPKNSSSNNSDNNSVETEFPFPRGASEFCWVASDFADGSSADVDDETFESADTFDFSEGSPMADSPAAEDALGDLVFGKRLSRRMSRKRTSRRISGIRQEPLEEAPAKKRVTSSDPMTPLVTNNASSSNNDNSQSNTSTDDSTTATDDATTTTAPIAGADSLHLAPDREVVSSDASKTPVLSPE
ncbi:MAG: hypothetical protein MHM6MM_006229 [Cercozoa sp. M6MM]